MNLCCGINGENLLGFRASTRQVLEANVNNLRLIIGHDEREGERRTGDGGKLFSLRQISDDWIGWG